MKRKILIFSYLYPEKLVKAVKYINRLLRSKYYAKKIDAGKNFYVYSFRNLKGEENINVGDNFNAGKNLRLEAWTHYKNDRFSPKVSIGDNVMLGDDNHIGSINEISIGNNLLTGSNVYITDHNHGKSIWEESSVSPAERRLYSKGKVCIGDNVWLGNNVVVMPDVVIGNGAIIGANSVVTKSIPENAVAAGVPAVIMRINNDNNSK